MNKLIKTINLIILLYLLSANTINAQTNQDREIENIANQLVQKISGTEVKNVAVADFANLDGTYSELGKYLATEFSFALTSIDKDFNIIDRSKVNFLLKEAGLEDAGLVDPNTIAKLGNLKGIDAIVSGSLTPQGNNMRVFINVLELETASVLAAVRGDISLNPDIQAMSGDIKISSKLKVEDSFLTRLNRIEIKIENKLKTIVDSILPIGTIVPYYGELTELPDNWKLCDGRKIEDFSSEFFGLRTPDLDGYFIRGTANFALLGQPDGQDEIPSHTHIIPNHKHQIGDHHHNIITHDDFFGRYFEDVGLSNGGYVKGKFIIGGNYKDGLNHRHEGYTIDTSHSYTEVGGGGSTESSGGHDNRPKFKSLFYIIKIK